MLQNIFLWNLRECSASLESLTVVFFFFFLCPKRNQQKAEALFSVLRFLLLCQPLCALEWHSGSVTNSKLQILFIFIFHFHFKVMFHLKLFESALNLNKISEN